MPGWRIKQGRPGAPRRKKKAPARQGLLYKTFTVLPFVDFFAGSSRGCSGSWCGGMSYFLDDVIGNAGAGILYSAFILRYGVVVVGVEIEIRHQFRLYVIDCFRERLEEFVEIFLV